jgi:pimeloyl-ACP methyl ester carboxylesterase
MKLRCILTAGVLLYLFALGMMFLPSMLHLNHTSVEVPVSEERMSTGTLWEAGTPNAVMLIGHGVTSNRGIMALLAKSFALNGYAALALDFWGHGESRERFDWNANPEQLQAWVTWARKTYPNLPVAYLGHSMGGFAGADAFNENPSVDAFVSLGALPGSVPACKTAVAAGIFEELFTIEDAKEHMTDKADVISSPFSNHASETADPLLISRIIDWVNGALGVGKPVVFPWMIWAMSLLAVILGCAGVLLLASAFTAAVSKDAIETSPAASARTWSVNPYRVAAVLLGARGVSSPPRSGGFFGALLRGIFFGVACAVLLTILLNVHIFTVSITHPGRLLTWLILTPLFTMFAFLDLWVLERVPLKNAGTRFAAAALTRATPLLVLTVLLRLTVPGLNFLGMMLGIFAFILVMLALVHALATRAASDWRAGAMASATLFAWVIAFWFPLYWPWV